jgi:phosphoribosyl-ATP pyrophosphohydrolase/phosphoribosyl-AMP cyclohydrolase
VAEVALDCDGDALLYRVDAAGPACHTGARSCFEEAPAGEGLAPVAGEAPERLDEGSGGGPGDGGGDDAMAAGEAPERLDEGGHGEAGGRGVDGATTAGAPPAGIGRSAVAASLAGPRLELGWLWDVLVERAAADPSDSYTARLLAAGVDRIARKVGEEATEVVIAALRTVPTAGVVATPDQPPLAGAVAATSPAPAAVVAPGSGALSPLAAEAADLLYHLLVLLLAAGVPPEEVAAELRRRHARPPTPPSPKAEDRR